MRLAIASVPSQATGDSPLSPVCDGEGDDVSAFDGFDVGLTDAQWSAVLGELELDSQTCQFEASSDAVTARWTLDGQLSHLHSLVLSGQMEDAVAIVHQIAESEGKDFVLAHSVCKVVMLRKSYLCSALRHVGCPQTSLESDPFDLMRDFVEPDSSFDWKLAVDEGDQLRLYSLVERASLPPKGVPSEAFQRHRAMLPGPHRVWTRMEGIIDIPPIAAASVLFEVDLFPRWMPHYTRPIQIGMVGGNVVDRNGVADVAAWSHMRLPWPLHDRLSSFFGFIWHDLPVPDCIRPASRRAAAVGQPTVNVVAGADGADSGADSGPTELYGPGDGTCGCGSKKSMDHLLRPGMPPSPSATAADGEARTHKMYARLVGRPPTGIDGIADLRLDGAVVGGVKAGPSPPRGAQSERMDGLMVCEILGPRKCRLRILFQTPTPVAPPALVLNFITKTFLRRMWSDMKGACLAADRCGAGVENPHARRRRAGVRKAAGLPYDETDLVHCQQERLYADARHYHRNLFGVEPYPGDLVD
eukprot:GDKH01014357.1.p1 GENE.GDKH01014357.1~~GDKH01014357.1.p1  ORF type:complete len:528 (+),score=43.12 GDKH01014357.1:108-1691(+)